MIKLCGRNAVQIVPSQPSPVDFQDLAKRLQGAGRTRSNPYLMLLEVEDHEITLFPDGRAIVKGTDDPAVARSLYARYVGK
jgi:adenylyltransferase/sulfurtransferase